MFGKKRRGQNAFAMAEEEMMDNAEEVVDTQARGELAPENGAPVMQAPATTKPKKRGGSLGLGKAKKKDDMRAVYEGVNGELEDTAESAGGRGADDAESGMKKTRSGFLVRQKKKREVTVVGRSATAAEPVMAELGVPQAVPLRKRRSIAERDKEEEQKVKERRAAISFENLDDDSSNYTSESGFFSKPEKTSIEKSLISEDEAEFVLDENGNIVEQKEQKGVLEFVGTASGGIRQSGDNGKGARDEEADEQGSGHGRETTSDVDITASSIGISAGTESAPVASSVGCKVDTIAPVETAGSSSVTGSEMQCSVSRGEPAGSVPEKHFSSVSSVRERFELAVSEYNNSLSNAERAEGEISVVFDDDKHQELIFDELSPNKFLLPNTRVYAKDKQQMWNSAYEVRVPRGKTVELDFGLSIVLPQGYALELQTVPECGEKYGLRWVNGKTVYTAEEAEAGITVEVQGCTDTSYIAEYKRLFTGRIIKFGAA